MALNALRLKPSLRSPSRVFRTLVSMSICGWSAPFLRISLSRRLSSVSRMDLRLRSFSSIVRDISDSLSEDKSGLKM